VRQAVAYALNQKDIWLRHRRPGMVRECKSLYPCGSPLNRPKGSTTARFEFRQGARAAAGSAMRHADRVMQSTDIVALSNLAPVSKSLLENRFRSTAGMDWQTLVTRRTKRDRGSGGWTHFSPPGHRSMCLIRSPPVFSTRPAKATFAGLRRD